MKIIRKYMQSIEQGGRMNIPSRGLKMIGIRFYPSDVSGGEEERCAQHIQKSLYGHTDWYYFNKGFYVTEKDSVITEIQVDESAFDSSFLLYTGQGSETIVSLSAIVGENGTGKSTIIDNVIRLLNNLSAAIIGEHYVYSTAQHLHYIDGVYASLAFYQGSDIKVLTCKGRCLTVSRFSTDSAILSRQCDRSSPDNKETYKSSDSDTVIVFNNTTPSSEPLPPQDDKKYILRDWFYTLVSNYSLYAYNYRDYLYQNSSKDKMKKLNGGQVPENLEDWFWLKGIFHKNDSYQTPVVIHPMRNDGYIDASMVNAIGKQCMISLCFEKGQKGGFPFRTINQTHHIVAFTFYQDRNEFSNSVEKLLESKFPDIESKYIQTLMSLIISFWSKSIGVEYNLSGDFVIETWNYLVYKTIKVLRTYIEYQDIWKKIESGVFQDSLDTDLLELLKDSSHRTQKIRRAVCYLRFNVENYVKDGPIVPLKSVDEWMEKKVGQELYPGKALHRITVEDLLPTPVAGVRLELVDNEHFEAYEKGIYNNFIPFEGLSSGERQIAYTLGNLIYHLKNIESCNDDGNDSTGHKEALRYNYANVLLDEVELYFHPDLQRRFVKLLLDSIAGLDLSGNRGINITLVTHSPFVLSDIPDSNVLYLSRKNGERPNGKTFAANVHDLFNDTFFLPYTMGSLAQTQITEIIDFYELFRNRRSEWRKELWNWEEKSKRMKYIARIIGDEYLSSEINDMLEEMEDWITNITDDNEED